MVHVEQYCLQRSLYFFLAFTIFQLNTIDLVCTEASELRESDVEVEVNAGITEGKLADSDEVGENWKDTETEVDNDWSNANGNGNDYENRKEGVNDNQTNEYDDAVAVAANDYEN